LGNDNIDKFTGRRLKPEAKKETLPVPAGRASLFNANGKVSR
jgi:hypothetical protein